MSEKLTCGECLFYKPDYGIWCVNGWSGDGSRGDCFVEPKTIRRNKKDKACRFFENAKEK